MVVRGHRRLRPITQEGFASSSSAAFSALVFSSVGRGCMLPTALFGIPTDNGALDLVSGTVLLERSLD